MKKCGNWTDEMNMDFDDAWRTNLFTLVEYDIVQL